MFVPTAIAVVSRYFEMAVGLLEEDQIVFSRFVVVVFNLVSDASDASLTFISVYFQSPVVESQRLPVAMAF